MCLRSGFIGAKDDGGDNWSYKMCKAPVKPSLQMDQHPTFYRPDALPVTQPTVSNHCMEKGSYFMDLLISSTP